jgi:hypothetical protein
MKLSQRLPQNWDLVQEYDRRLKLHVSEVRDYTYAFHRRWESKGVMTMRGTGWAVRPFLLPAARLHFVASAFHSALNSLRNAMSEAAATSGAIARLLPFDPNFEYCVDVADGVSSPAFLSHFRPDGFLFEDRFVLSEINYGNGIIVSCGYTEAVADYWSNHPVLKQLGCDVERLHRRPLPWLINVARRFARPVLRPRVALMAHSEEWKTLLSYPRRVIDQINFARDQFRRAGLRARIVTEHDVAIDQAGQLRFEEDGQRVDLLMFITVGISFMDYPWRLKAGGTMSHFGQARVGDTWVLKPLAGLLVDKGALPLLGTLQCSQQMPDGFRFEIAPTEFPHEKSPSRYLHRPSDWVIKRSFDGKDTHIGVTCDATSWRGCVDIAVKDFEYVAQRYISMPRAEVPVLVDEKYLEWVSSRVELSSFIYDGAFGGAGARHAPDAEGLVMTDFPKDYGYSSVFSV